MRLSSAQRSHYQAPGLLRNQRLIVVVIIIHDVELGVEFA
jgi:hypothetical protein